MTFNHVICAIRGDDMDPIWILDGPIQFYLSKDQSCATGSYRFRLRLWNMTVLTTLWMRRISVGRCYLALSGLHSRLSLELRMRWMRRSLVWTPLPSYDFQRRESAIDFAQPTEPESERDLQCTVMTQRHDDKGAIDLLKETLASDALIL